MATTTTRTVPASQSSKTAAGDGDGAPAAKKSKKKLIIIAVVVLLVAGIGAKMTILKPKVSAAAAAEKKKTAPPEFGPIVALDEQTLNLADGHFLKLKVVIQLKKAAKLKAAAAEATTTPELSVASQTVLDLYSSYSQAQLTGAAAQAKVKDVLVQKLGPLYPDEIADVYTPEFLMSS